MGLTSLFSSAKEKEKKLKEIKASEGFDEVNEFMDRFELKKKTDKALEMKDAVTESFLEKKKIATELQKSAENQPWWRRGLKWAIGGGFGLLLGKGFLKEKETEMVSETLVQGVDIVTDDQKLKEANDILYKSVKEGKEIVKMEEKINKEWKLAPKEKVTNWMQDLERQEEKYENYGKGDAMKEAWKKTEFEYDEETGEKKKRNFFWRIFAFLPALMGTYKEWKLFESLKKSGALEKIRRGEMVKKKAEQEIKNAEAKIDRGIETKNTAFSSVFEENPGAIEVSKSYLTKLWALTKNADKYTSAQRAMELEKIAKTSVNKGVAKYGPGFTKMKGFEKYMPGVSVKARGGFMVVEIIGPALGKALREGAQGGGISKALDIFVEEVKDMENWKDACPLWGTWRSGERLFDDNNNAPFWSRGLEFGLSLGMDAAMVAGMAASLGSLSAPLIAARGAASTGVRGLLRKLTFKQVVKNSVKTSGKVVSKGLTKETKKRVVMAAGGKWALRINLMLLTIGEFFGDDIEKVKEEVKAEAKEMLLSDEQRYSLALTHALKNGEEPLSREDFLAAEEDKKKKKVVSLKEIREEQEKSESTALKRVA